MSVYLCRKCGREVNLTEDEYFVFHEHHLFYEGDLLKCPLCIVNPLSAVMDIEQLSMNGDGWFRHVSGYRVTESQREIVVEPRRE